MTPPEVAAAQARLQEAWKVLGFLPTEADPDFYGASARAITHAGLTGVLIPSLARAVEHVRFDLYPTLTATTTPVRHRGPVPFLRGDN